MMENKPIPHFPKKLVLRIASGSYVETGSREDFFERVRKDNSFLRALHHANPFVYERAVEWFSGSLTDKKKIAKISHTLYNYYTRWYCSTVPYGFFSSVGVINWSEDPGSITVDRFRAAYRLDMGAINKLANYIFSHEAIRNALRYFPNNTIYTIGNYIRFLETFEEGGLSYKISAVEKADILMELLEKAKPGITIHDLAALFVNDDYTIDDLSYFINELVDAQLLVPEIQLNISGTDVFTRLHTTVTGLPLSDQPDFLKISAILSRIKAILAELEEKEDQLFDLWAELKKIFEDLGIERDEKFLLQVDNFVELTDNTIDEKLIGLLYEGIAALSCFNQNNYKPYIENFKKKFTERYEDNSVPLLQVIDSESGISFGDITFQNDSLLLNDAPFVQEQDSYLSRSAKGDELRDLLYKKYYEAQKTNSGVIRFSKEEFTDKTSRVSELAPNFQIIFSVVDKEKELLYLKTVGNSSGANLLARFGYASEPLKDILRNIMAFEAGYHKDSIVAEIIHISEYRSGNITFRAVTRDYEIPVHTPSVLPDDRQIALSDLMVCVKAGEVVLWSKKLRKRIIPVLTNAHNHNRKTSPLYQFLAEISYQGLLPSLHVDRADLSSIGNHLPRIQFENIILTPAQWRFGKKDLQLLHDRQEVLSETDLNDFREKWGLVPQTFFIEGGSKVLVDWTSVMSVQYFLKSAGANHFIVLEESLFEPGAALVHDIEGRPYASECIISVNNTLKLPAVTVFTGSGSPAVNIKYHVGQEWVYYKLYCGVVTGDKLLCHEIRQAIDELFEKKLISQFFFLRFYEPDYHIRIRFKTTPELVGEVVGSFHRHIQEPLKDDMIWKSQIDTYIRELERYGHDTIDFAEAVFQSDSFFVLDLIPLIRESYAESSPFLFIKGVDTLLQAFGLDEEEKCAFLKQRKEAYQQEFKSAKNIPLRQSILKKEMQYRRLVQEILRGQYTNIPGQPDAARLEEIVNDLEKAVKKNYEQYKHLLTPSRLRSLLTSFAHMQAIRIFQTKPRQNEFIAYELLHAAYSAQLKTKKIPS